MPTSPFIRVASVPAGHPYVAHLGTRGVVRLPDPTPPGAPPGRWWPPQALDPAWIAANADRFDLLHVHFGMEARRPDEFEATVAALRAAGRPLVHTVHDLEHPQLSDQAPHLALLDVVVPAADALVTLTAGAAREVERRWGRRPVVVPHPHLLPLDAPLPPGRAGRMRTVGLHLRDLRPNVDGPGTVRRLLGAVAALRAGGEPVVARVVLHPHVRDAAARAEVRRLCAAASFVTLTEAPRPADAALHAELADLDASVLPYRHGTHSGWAELCWDLAVPVVTAPVGHVAEQHPELVCDADLEAGLRRALAQPGPGTAARVALQRARRGHRRTQADRIAAAHLELYARVLAGAGVGVGG